MVEGIGGGFAKYFGIDVSIACFIWLLLCLAGGFGMCLYLISAIPMPNEIKKHYHRARRIKRGADEFVSDHSLYWYLYFMGKSKPDIFVYWAIIRFFCTFHILPYH